MMEALVVTPAIGSADKINLCEVEAGQETVTLMIR